MFFGRFLFFACRLARELVLLFGFLGRDVLLGRGGRTFSPTAPLVSSTAPSASARLLPVAEPIASFARPASCSAP